MSRQRPKQPLQRALFAGIIAATALVAAQAHAQRAGPSARSNDTAVMACSQAATAGDRTEQAVVSCDQALRAVELRSLGPGEVYAVLMNAGVVRLLRSEYDQALALFDRALEAAPDDPIALLNRGAVLVRLDRNADAVSTLTRALSLGVPDPHRAYYYRGTARRRLNDLRGALEDFNTALEIAPTFAPAQQSRDDVTYEIGHPEAPRRR